MSASTELQLNPELQLYLTASQSTITRCQVSTNSHADGEEPDLAEMWLDEETLLCFCGEQQALDIVIRACLDDDGSAHSLTLVGPAGVLATTTRGTELVTGDVTITPDSQSFVLTIDHGSGGWTAQIGFRVVTGQERLEATAISIEPQYKPPKGTPPPSGSTEYVDDSPTTNARSAPTVTPPAAARSANRPEPPNLLRLDSRALDPLGHHLSNVMSTRGERNNT